ncbi:hypothetical protein RhiirC2_799705 [Rhizophagus irregularis]|uniref:RNI-like protein n=1 Tax=Rhizophagus irregularis TaxID=588596 RepID=A0A2N1M4K6_9GLOM|nr:hypothetical protein RhiirC2_799705 [Rhizophagus irregularis]
MESDQPKALRVKHLTSLTNIPPKSTSPETSLSESSSSESSSSLETSSSESSSSETSSSESSSSDSDIDEISSTGFSDNALNLIAGAYPNLRNITDKSLFVIADKCHDLQEFHSVEAHWVTDKSISCILNSCPNLRKLGIAYSRGDIKDASTLMRKCFSIEYIDFSGTMALQNDVLIIAIIKRSPNLRHLEIDHNDIDDEVTEAIAHTCHKLEYLDLGDCGFVSEPSICNVIRSCPKLQHLDLSYCDITTKKPWTS